VLYTTNQTPQEKPNVVETIDPEAFSRASVTAIEAPLAALQPSTSVDTSTTAVSIHAKSKVAVPEERLKFTDPGLIQDVMMSGDLLDADEHGLFDTNNADRAADMDKVTTALAPAEGTTSISASVAPPAITMRDGSIFSGDKKQVEHPPVKPIRRLLPASDEELVRSGWPWQGGIVFNGVKMRYREDFDPVLVNVTVNIAPGASVGIVGRTGSGKSSLFRGLLRLTELEAGMIAIDGVDAAAVGLDALRSGISIIPQDPVLFSGSIR
jgi:ABC-type multidrug transport system fused ATPase/permease subunit